MKKIVLFALSAGLLAFSGCTTTKTTTTAATPAATPPNRLPTGREWPAATNQISWSGTAKKSFGKTVATIEVDTTEVPELAAWGKHAGEISAEWYPKIAVLLGEDPYLTNRVIR